MDLSHTKLRRTSVVGGIVYSLNPSGDADESRAQDSIKPTTEYKPLRVESRVDVRIESGQVSEMDAALTASLAGRRL